MKKRLANWWYGPLSPEQERKTDIRRPLGPGVITVQTLQEAITQAQKVIDGLARSGQGLRIEPVITSEAHGFENRYEVEDLTTIGEVALNELVVRWDVDEHSSAYVELRISAKGSWIHTEGLAPQERQVATDAGLAILRVLEHEVYRRTPYHRIIDSRAAAAVLSLLGVWLWAMVATAPPFAMWLLALASVSAPCWLAWKAIKSRVRRIPNPPELLRVDTTPRDELKSRRHNARQDWKQRLWTTAAVAPVSAIVGAVLQARAGGTP